MIDVLNFGVRLELGRSDCISCDVSWLKARSLSSIGTRMLYIVKLIASIIVGALGGWICGFIILSFGAYIGESGNHGVGDDEGPGYWNPVVMFGLAGFYGMPLGLVIFPIGYLGFLQKVPIQRALLFTVIGTLVGGLSGALMGPPPAALCGVVGFFIASILAGRKISNSN